jgi:hypothetical protein
MSELSLREKELAQVKAAEAEGAHGTGKRTNIVGSTGVSFPVNEEARNAIAGFASDDAENLVQLVRPFFGPPPQRLFLSVLAILVIVDVPWLASVLRRRQLIWPLPIQLKRVRRFEISFLRRNHDLLSSVSHTITNPKKQDPQVPSPPPLFFQIDSYALVFIYSCPTSSSIKNRMLYASSRSAILSVAAELGVKVDTKIETSEVDELTLKFLFKQVHRDDLQSVGDEKKKGFARPRGPMRRVQRTGTPALSSGGEGESGTE